MSQYPPQYPGYQGVPNYYGGPAAPNARPGAVTSIAIIGIILGSLGLLCAGPSAILTAMSIAAHGKNPIAPQLPPMPDGLLYFSMFQCVFNVVLALTLLVCSIGALSLKPYARSVLIPWSVISLIWWAIVLVVQLTWMGPETARITRSVARANAAFNAGQDVGMIIGAVVMSVFMCALPVAILALWNGPRVKAAFGVGGTPQSPPFASNYPPQYPPTYPQG